MIYKSDPNLQALWLKEEASGTRYDYTPNGYHMTDNNTVGYSSDSMEGVNSADYERDSSEYLSRADPPNLKITGDLTLGCWLRCESQGGTRQLISKYISSAGNRSYKLQISNSTQVYFLVSSDGSAYTICSGNLGAISNDTWYHVVGVYNGTDMRIYVDGSLDSATNNPKTYSSGIYDSGTAVTLGADGAGGNLFDGKMDVAAIFNRALSAAEVSDWYNFGIWDTPQVMIF